MPVKTIAPGMRVLCRDSEWLVTRVEPSDRIHKSYAIHCIGADDLVRGQERIFLEQLDKIEPVDPRDTRLVDDESSGYRMARLFLEAQLRQMPVTNIKTDLEGMGVFQPMEYQEKAVQCALSQLRPRLLLADAVGLGKTIEVGMILSELMRRGRANRILVLAKKSMLTQFQAELWNRFGIPLVRLDSNGIAKLRLFIPASKNPFEIYHRIIISIDTLKDVGRYRHFLEETRWDVVVIDEAHNVAGASVPERHLSHRLAKLLSRRTDSMILTTATPHNGKRETFGRLISLLDPSAIPDPRLKEYTSEDIKGFFLMRFKEDVREEAGDNFRQREVVPLSHTSIDATIEEEGVLDVLLQMRQEAVDDLGRRQVDTLMQYGLYKMFLSSPEACQSTLANRMKKLNEKDTADNELPWLEKLRKKLEGQTIQKSSRYQMLKQQLQEMGWDGGPNSPRVLLFTEYRKTQDALVKALAKDFKIKYSDKFEDQGSQAIGSIHGSMSDIHLMSTVESFGTGTSPIRLMVATDVASEGINLHHACNNIIHYDLPWSIITLIQRNGRVDRFGQKKTPYLRYLMVNGKQDVFKGDKDIFNRLVDKVEEINRATRSGESVLKLYDPQAEEQYIAQQGILKGNLEVLEKVSSEKESAEAAALEETLQQATSGADAELAELLLGETDNDLEKSQKEQIDSTSRLRLYKDRDFFTEGYRYLSEVSVGYQSLSEHNGMLCLDAPRDLKRRLGAPGEKGTVIFGATAIPPESWPKNDQFFFTDNVERADIAIAAARNTSGHWAKTQLCMENHPVMKWISERLVMLMKRGEAPYVRSKYLKDGELCFCFIGQVSSQAGTPFAVDAHAISFLKGGEFKHRSLHQALEDARFHDLVNTGSQSSSTVVEQLIPSAVEASIEHMKCLKSEQENEMLPILRKEERRLRKWRQKRIELLEDLIEASPQRAKRYRQQIEDMEGYLADRQQNWRDTYCKASSEPSTRLVLVIEGEN